MISGDRKSGMHTIQLRGPWQARVLSRASSCADKPTEQDVPDDKWHRVTLGDWSAWLGVEFRGVVRFERRFGCPTGLTESTRVTLVVEAVDFRAEISLNDQRVGQCQWGEGPWRTDIRDQLQPRNRLTIDVEMPVWEGANEGVERAGRAQLAGGLLGPVYLELLDDPSARGR